MRKKKVKNENKATDKGTDEKAQDQIQKETEETVSDENEEKSEKFDDITENCKEEDSESCSGARIEIAREFIKEEARFHWMLYSANGRMIATNPVEYTRLNDLKQAIKSVQESIQDAPLVRLY